ncbi:MAG TPA: hypothetical protein VFQ68_04550 [Streptosporangiaceae bacterium]|nr:hypothetical protein [Streptosporangiaceae bacterium]
MATVTAAGVGVGVGAGLDDGMVTVARVVAGELDGAGVVATGELHAVSVPAATAIHSLRIINSGSPAGRLLFGHYV